MFYKHLITALIVFFLSESVSLYSQNPRIDGYKGIWFSSGLPTEYGYKFSGGAATFASRHRPIAIYSPEVKKTFFVYGGTKSEDERHLLIMASYFDHKRHVVPKPVIVYDKMGVKEPYDNASLSIDNEGYLWIFISGYGRTRSGFIFKSSEPYSVNSFDLIREMEMMSPQPWWINDYGFMILFSRVSKGTDLFFEVSPDGRNWSAGQKLTAMGGNMQITERSGKKIITAFNYLPGGNIDRQTNLYLIRTEDFGKTWKTIDGKEIKIPLTDKINEALIRDFESEGKLVYLSDIDFDKEGNPVLLILLSSDINPGPAGDPREWIVVYRRDQKWQFSRVCESTHNFDRGFIYISDDAWKIIGPTEPGPQKYGTGGEIALWVSRNQGGDWEKELDVTVNSINNNSFVRHPINPHKDFFALWADGNAEELSKSYLYFTNEKCDRVWVFPYEMKSDFQKPVRIK